MPSRRNVLKSAGGVVASLPLLATGSTVGSTSDQSPISFLEALEQQGYSKYQPEHTSLNEGGKTPDEGGQYTTRVYHKEDLTTKIREKSNGDVNRPGAIFFEQELTGNWKGSWGIDGSIGEVSSNTQYEFHNTNNIDISLINLNINLLSPDIDYSKENTTIENQTVRGKTQSKSLVPAHAIGHIVSTFENILLSLGCGQLRYSDGLWRNMVAGEKYIAHDDKIDYAKKGVSMAHRTYNAEWNEEDSVEITNGGFLQGQADIRAYLSIESQGGDRHLAVGGFYVHEDKVEFDSGWTSTATTIENSPENLQDEIIQLMASRKFG